MMILMLGVAAIPLQFLSEVTGIQIMLSFVFLWSLIIEFTEAIYEIDSTLVSRNITCPADDCIVNLQDYDESDCRIVICAIGYSCTINCQSCGWTTISAISVSNFEINCKGDCRGTIDVTLSSSDSQFTLNCNTSNPCYPINIINVAHTEDIYTGIVREDYSVNINCNGQASCDRIHVDATINGYFNAKCNGESACSGTIIYNPPMNTGLMEIECISSNNLACSRMNIISPATQKISMSGNDTSPSNIGRSINIFGPVYPFPIDTEDHTFDTINIDSVQLNCGQSYCGGISIAVPFGIFQTSLIGIEYDRISFICGYDFATTGICTCDT